MTRKCIRTPVESCWGTLILTSLYTIAGEEDLDQDQLRRPPEPQHGRRPIDADGDGDSGLSPPGDPRGGRRYHGGFILEVDLISDLDKNNTKLK